MYNETKSKYTEDTGRGPYGTNPKETRKALADAKRLCRYNGQLRADIRKSCEGQIIYREGLELPKAAQGSRYKNCRTKVCVSQKQTLEAASAYKGKKVCVLHFAMPFRDSLYAQGHEQETQMCQCSTLYPVLASPKAKEKFYDVLKMHGTFLGTDDCAYTPDITVFKERTDDMSPMQQDDWYSVNVISCTPPQTEAKEYKWLDADAIRALLIRRFCRILDIAKLHGNEVVVLGPFGCHDAQGCSEELLGDSFGYFLGNSFGNVRGFIHSALERILESCRLVDEIAEDEEDDIEKEAEESGDEERILEDRLETTIPPRLVARAARDVLKAYQHDFEQIEFAMGDGRDDRMGYETFADVLCPRQDMRGLNSCRGIKWVREGIQPYPRHGICAHYNPAILYGSDIPTDSNAIIRRAMKKIRTGLASSCITDSLQCEACGIYIKAGQQKKIDQIVRYLNEGGDDAAWLSALFHGVAVGEIHQQSPLDIQVKEAYYSRDFVPPRNIYL